MNRYWTIPLLSSILILGSLGFSQDVFAPASQKPEQITSAQPSWNAASQEFVVRVTAIYGVSEASENSDYELVTRLEISDVNSADHTPDAIIVVGSKVKDVIKIAKDTSPGEEVSGILKIPWDRILEDGSTFLSPADVKVEVQVLNPSGNPVATSVSFIENLKLGYFVPSGDNVRVEIPVNDGCLRHISVEFEKVLEEGIIDLQRAAVEDLPTLPEELQITPCLFNLVPRNSVLIEFTGTFLSPAQIEWAYDPDGLDLVRAEEDTLKLFHSDDGRTWEDITTDVNSSIDTVCGTTSDFSPFALMIPK